MEEGSSDLYSNVILQLRREREDLINRYKTPKNVLTVPPVPVLRRDGLPKYYKQAIIAYKFDLLFCEVEYLRVQQALAYGRPRYRRMRRRSSC
jgi:hypothetical protein